MSNEQSPATVARGSRAVWQATLNRYIRSLGPRSFEHLGLWLSVAASKDRSVERLHVVFRHGDGIGLVAGVLDGLLRQGLDLRFLDAMLA